jgi:hypothetical protein
MRARAGGAGCGEWRARPLPDSTVVDNITIAAADVDEGTRKHVWSLGTFGSATLGRHGDACRKLGDSHQGSARRITHASPFASPADRFELARPHLLHQVTVPDVVSGRTAPYVAPHAWISNRRSRRGAVFDTLLERPLNASFRVWCRAILCAKQPSTQAGSPTRQSHARGGKLSPGPQRVLCVDFRPAVG